MNPNKVVNGKVNYQNYYDKILSMDLLNHLIKN